MKTKIKDITIRAGKTFIQAFLGTLITMLSAIEITNIDLLKTTIISALVGALSAGLCAVMNLFITLLKKGK